MRNMGGAIEYEWSKIKGHFAMLNTIASYVYNKYYPSTRSNKYIKYHNTAECNLYIICGGFPVAWLVDRGD